MKFVSASTLAYDDNEVHIGIETAPGECICVGDVIDIPMNDRTIERREVVEIRLHTKKGSEKQVQQISNGELGYCIVHEIHSGHIHTINSPYDDEIQYLGEPVACDISNQAKAMSEKIVSEFQSNPEDDEIFEKLLHEEADWEIILQALLHTLTIPTDNENLYQYVAGIIWDGLCDGYELGIYNETATALLYGRLGNSQAPYENNLIWSIVSKANHLDYANSEYNPLKDKRIIQILNDYNIIYS